MGRNKDTADTSHQPAMNWPDQLAELLISVQRWSYKMWPPKPTIFVDLSLVIPIYNHGFS